MNNGLSMDSLSVIFATGIFAIFTLLIVIIVQYNTIKRYSCASTCKRHEMVERVGLYVKLENAVKWFQVNWTLFVVYTASSSIIMLFLLTIIYPQKDTLVTMNSWVSLILGFTALFMSVASMVLSFYNVEQSHKNELNTAEMNRAIDEKLKSLDKLEALIKQSTKEIKQAREDISAFREETNDNLDGLIKTSQGFVPDDGWVSRDGETRLTYSKTSKLR